MKKRNKNIVVLLELVQDHKEIVYTEIKTIYAIEDGINCPVKVIRKKIVDSILSGCFQLFEF